MYFVSQVNSNLVTKAYSSNECGPTVSYIRGTALLLLSYGFLSLLRSRFLFQFSFCH